ncbi:Gfo/Idh/MocA family oxidoreductase [Flammeovirga kamogawensis]|uniref:Gfo/Idh/MocA family oxidoreductase n=1 Tax=Flammeovirga kamogawensis TaxID=373891 RepID=A0ABX8GYX8_9BACT|nr:Gfo/Idh/MocA family oxidoreductase [Flammeovirga kamogawensis]MBB6458900.1 putative dehydrogenase [Flammeovirga kamogawensis]QWG08481.1 Gfo/Idh/MocA family oxidoreductase [Flammeovirga kamogawensis]
MRFIRKDKNIGIIGSGQFAFATIGFFLKKYKGNIINENYDIDHNNSTTFSNYYESKPSIDVNDLISNPVNNLIYIVSNHYSHTPYAIQCLKRNKNIYIEKPISVTYLQLVELKQHLLKSNSNIYCGYNRPHSPAIKEIHSKIISGNQPITLNCFIIGHKIDKEHWYRNKNEGTRICGNVGHWLDLSIHLLVKRQLPNKFQFHLISSNQNEKDDNSSIILTSDLGDLINITLSSREEPFEGINETINFQQGDIIAKIDDFRRMTIWESSKVITRRYFRKDVGHKNAILQPFRESKRDWKEVELSTLIMIRLTEMIYKNLNSYTFDIKNELNILENETNNPRS